MSEQRDWISVPEAARLVGLSERATRDWLRRHEVPTNQGRPLLVDRAALERKLAEVGGARSSRTPHRPGSSPEPPQMPQEPIEATFRDAHTPQAPSAALVPLSSFLEQSGRWAAEFRQMAERLDERGLELGAARNENERLKAAVEQLRAELEAERQRGVAPSPSEVAAAAPEVPRKWWRRLLP